MKNMKGFFVLLLGGFLMLYACQKDNGIVSTAEDAVSMIQKDDFGSKAELIDYYLNTIEDQKKIGSSVVFQVGDHFVENPDREALEGILEPAVDDDCNYCYQFEYRATVATSAANYEAWSTTTPSTLLWSQSTPGGGFTLAANTLYVSPWVCFDLDTPPCINILWDVNTVTGTGFCNYFSVRVRKPSGATSAVSAVGANPIPSVDNVLGPWCPTGERCCDIELLQECVQDENGCWYTLMTPTFNNVPIGNEVGAPCKAFWSFIYTPPAPPGCPYPANWQQSFPMMVPECGNWMVTIKCGDCIYQEMGVASCFADCGQ